VKEKDKMPVGMPDVDFGNQRVDAILDGYLKRWVPSLIFTGPEGVGKEYTAIMFAKKLLPMNPARAAAK